MKKSRTLREAFQSTIRVVTPENRKKFEKVLQAAIALESYASTLDLNTDDLQQFITYMVTSVGAGKSVPTD